MLGARPLAEAPMPTLALTLALMPTLALSLTHTPAALVDALATTDARTVSVWLGGAVVRSSGCC